jgi:hypothetical protein
MEWRFGMDPFWRHYYEIALFASLLVPLAGVGVVVGIWVAAGPLLGSDSTPTSDGGAGAEVGDSVLRLMRALSWAAAVLGCGLGALVFGVPARLFGTAAPNSLADLAPGGGLGSVVNVLLMPFLGAPGGLIALYALSSLALYRRARVLAKGSPGGLSEVDRTVLRLARRDAWIMLAASPVIALVVVPAVLLLPLA